MRVLVTGALGNVGFSAVKACLAAGHEVVMFDRLTKKTLGKARLLRKWLSATDRLRWIQGDLLAPDSLGAALLAFDGRGPDAVMHLAAILPPLSESHPELATRINVDGTRLLLDACTALQPRPAIVYASSIAIYGDRLARPWISIEDELAPNDHYAQTKVACEHMIRASGLPWTILRLSYVVASDWLPFDPLLFEVPPATRLEVVHTEDAGRAFAAACSCDAAQGRVFNIGGGSACRTTFRAYLDRIMRVMGLGNASFLPDYLFARNGFHCGWYADSDDAEAVLRFRTRTLEDYYSEVEWRMRFVRPLARIASWPVKTWLRSLSPYDPGKRHPHSRPHAAERREYPQP